MEEKKEAKQVKFRPIPIPSANLGLELKNSIVDLLSSDEGIRDSINTQRIEEFRNSTDNRNRLYEIFDEMCQADLVISSALELYADDATPYNTNRQIVWITSRDTEVAATCNQILKNLRIDESAWGHIHSLCKYGDLYLETFRGSEDMETMRGKKSIEDSDRLLNDDRHSAGGVLLEKVIVNVLTDSDNLSDYVEAVSNPAEIYDLTKRGKTVGFTKVPSSSFSRNRPQYNQTDYRINDQDIHLYDATKYVHIYLPNPSDRYPEIIRLFNSFDESADLDSLGDSKIGDFKVRRGRSVLQDIYRTHRELLLLEDSLLLNRVVRSALVRIIQVEVGEMGKPQTRELLARIKELFEQKTAFSKDQGLTEYSSPAPLENNVYMPTRNGLGAVSINTLGGDVNVKDISDIDYFNNKKFAGLKIPKPFLGFMDDAAGFSGGESLTKVSGRYAKTIKRIQNAYCQGIKTLINIYLLDRGFKAAINNFEVNMESPTTIEDAERAESLDTKARIIDTVMNLLSGVPDEDNLEKLKLLSKLVNEYLGMPEVSEIIDEIIEKHKANPQDADSKKDSDSIVDKSIEQTSDKLNDGENEDAVEDSENNEVASASTDLKYGPPGEDEGIDSEESLPSPGSIDVDLSTEG